MSFAGIAPTVGIFLLLGVVAIGVVVIGVVVIGVVGGNKCPSQIE